MRIVEATPRITHGNSTEYSLHGKPERVFVKQFEDKDKGFDIFFLKDNETAIVTDRMTNISYHGQKGDFPNLNLVKYIYSTYDDGFYTPEDFCKLIKGVYKGTKARVKPLNIWGELIDLRI